jgi:hypothetical protein
MTDTTTHPTESTSVDTVSPVSFDRDAILRLRKEITGLTGQLEALKKGAGGIAARAHELNARAVRAQTAVDAEAGDLMGGSAQERDALGVFFYGATGALDLHGALQDLADLFDPDLGLFAADAASDTRA